MEVRNCRRCRKLFNYIGGLPICPTCERELEDKFQEVKEYLRNNPRASLAQIAEENDTTIQQLKQWVREERLVFTDDSPVALECENCGALIRTGRYCKNCKGNLANNMQKAIHKPEPQVEKVKKPIREKERMRFLDKDL